MRVPRVQFTVRRMMVAVAIVSILFTYCRIHQQFHHAYWGGMARMHAEREMENRRRAELTNDPNSKRILIYSTGSESVLKERYEDVVSNPWKPVPPDLLNLP